MGERDISLEVLGDVLKRLFDVAVALVALLLLAVLIGMVALAIKLESRGPVFYRAPRVGRGGRKFAMLKFRKMRAAVAGPRVTVSDDERLTRVGRLLGRTKLDELPQLWNVLTGSMSLVGPRPQDPSFVALRRADYERILQVKPGITGLYQVAFLRECEILDARDPIEDYVDRLLPQKVHIDQLYVARRSIWLDLRILAWTAIALLFKREVAVDRSNGRLARRRRPAKLAPEPQADAVVGSEHA